MPSHPETLRRKRRSPGRSAGKGKSKAGARASRTGIRRSTAPRPRRRPPARR